MLKDLEERLLEYETVGEFLANLRKEFGEGDEKSVKLGRKNNRRICIKVQKSRKRKWV